MSVAAVPSYYYAAAAETCEEKLTAFVYTIKMIKLVLEGLARVIIVCRWRVLSLFALRFVDDDCFFLHNAVPFEMA